MWLLLAIVAPLRLRARSLAWLIVYLGACALLLAGGATLLLRHRLDFVDLLSSYLLPEGWRFSARTLIERILHAQGRQVLINASASVSLTALSLLFPLKERLSARYERDARLTVAPGPGLPLWLQAIEEGWLALVLVTAQLTVLWIGYPPDPSRRQLALGLSWTALFFSTGVSFLAPLLQRHRLRYATILKVLSVRPLTLFGFGALFALPPVLAGRLALAHGWPLQRAILLVAGSAVVSVAWATVAGTRVAAHLLAAAQATRPPHLVTRVAASVLLIALAAANARLYGAVALSLHHKSQLLKCHYRVLPSTLQLDLPDWSAALSKGVQVALRLDLEIENPTAFDVEIEENRLDLRFDGLPVALTSVTPLAVRAHATRTSHLEIPISLNLGVLAKGRALLDQGRWAATLYLRVTPELELPVYLLSPAVRPQE